MAIGIGLTMNWPPSSWDRLQDTAVALTGALVAATGFGIRQARAMTRLRQRSLQDQHRDVLDRRVRHGATVAIVLRALIAAITLATLAVIARIIGT